MIGLIRPSIIDHHNFPRPRKPDNEMNQTNFSGRLRNLGLDGSQPTASQSARKRKTFLSLEDARVWASSKKLKSRTQWNKLRNNPGFRTSNIPSNPAATYGEAFKLAGGWGWFLGTGNLPPKDRVFLPFPQARKWARKSGAKSQKQWCDLCKKPGWLPKGIPASPQGVYGDDFLGWGDFLDTRNIRPQDRVFISIEDASDWGVARRLSSSSAWFKAAKSLNWPENIPKDPSVSYGDAFYLMGGWGGFLRTGNVPFAARQWRSLDEAAAWARTQNITRSCEWFNLFRDNKIPKDVPRCPHKVYGSEFYDRGGWGWFIGTGYVAKQKREYLTLDDARSWAVSQGVSSQSDWFERCKQQNFPPANVPSSPQTVYGHDFKSRGGWGWFLGTGNKAPSDFEFMSIEDASRWAIFQGIYGSRSWREYMRLNQRPTNIPANPCEVYGQQFKNIGGWRGFLGQTKLSGVSKVELCMVRVLDEIFEAKSRKVAVMRLDCGAICKPDFIDERNRIIVEYDGKWYHQNRFGHDLIKTKRLTGQRHPWTVIRVREDDLPLVQEGLDVSVSSKDPVETRILNIIQHLISLEKAGVIRINGGTTCRAKAVLMRGLYRQNFSDLFTAGWASLEEASSWAVSNGISSQKDWTQRCKAPGFRPQNIPASPSKVYGDDFRKIGWGGFLKTGALSPAARKKPS